MRQETEHKNRLLPAIIKLGFDEWEEFFGAHKEDILIHRLEVNTTSPYIPSGSVLLVDTSKRWPIDGELFLVKFDPFVPQLKNIYWADHTKWRGKILKGPIVETRDLYAPFRASFKIKRGEFRKLTPEELEARKVDWIVGRVIGVVAMYHK